MNTDAKIKAIAAKLRHYRELNNITREQFCEKTDQNVEYWGTIERGERNISLGKLLDVCAAYEIDPASLLPSMHGQENTTAERAEIERRLPQYTKKQLSILVKFMDEILPNI